MTTSRADHENMPFTGNNAEKNIFANSVHKDLSIFVQDTRKSFWNNSFCKMESVIKFFLFQMRSDIIFRIMCEKANNYLNINGKIMKFYFQLALIVS